MVMVITDEILDVAEAVKAEIGSGVGIRVAEEMVEQGVELPASRVWVDGEPTDEMLPGTCALLPSQARALAGQYVGGVVLVLSGRPADVYAADVGEVILSGAVVEAAWLDGRRVY